MTTINADCSHPRVKHRHGTNACYVADGCRCDPCRAAMYRYGVQWRNARKRRLVDAAPVRDHLHYLHHDLGLSVRAISEASGVSWPCIRRVLDEGGRLRSDNAKALLSVTLETLPDDVEIGSRGTVRRIQALSCLGYSTWRIWEESGVQAGDLVARYAKNPRARIKVATAKRIDAYYRSHQVPFEPSDRHERMSATKALRAAERGNWAAPAMWDDIDRDPWPVDDQDAHEVLLCLRDGLDAQETVEAMGYTHPQALVSTMNHRAYRGPGSTTARMAYSELMKAMRTERQAAA